VALAALISIGLLSIATAQGQLLPGVSVDEKTYLSSLGAYEIVDFIGSKFAGIPTSTLKLIAGIAFALFGLAIISKVLRRRRRGTSIFFNAGFRFARLLRNPRGVITSPRGPQPVSKSRIIHSETFTFSETGVQSTPSSSLDIRHSPQPTPQRQPN